MANKQEQKNLKINIHVNSTLAFQSPKTRIIAHECKLADFVGFFGVGNGVYVEIVLVPQLVFIVGHIFMP